MIDAIVTGLRDLLSQPSFPRPVPEIGWLGVVAMFTWLAYALAGLRSAVLVLVGLLLFGFLGYWADSIDLLIVTFVAVLVVRDHRDPDGHLDGPQPAGHGGDHARSWTRCRPCRRSPTWPRWCWCSASARPRPWSPR